MTTGYESTRFEAGREAREQALPNISITCNYCQGSGKEMTTNPLLGGDELYEAVCHVCKGKKRMPYTIDKISFEAGKKEQAKEDIQRFYHKILEYKQIITEAKKQGMRELAVRLTKLTNEALSISSERSPRWRSLVLKLEEIQSALSELEKEV